MGGEIDENEGEADELLNFSEIVVVSIEEMHFC